MIAPRSLRWRLAAWMFAATASLGVLLTLYYQRRTHALLKAESDERLATLARHVAAASVLGTLAHSEELLAGPLDGAMSHADVLVVAVYDPAGRVIAARDRRGASPPQWRNDIVDCRPCALGGGRLRWVAPVSSARAAHSRSNEEVGFYDGPPPAASGGESRAGWLLLDVNTAALTAAERRITMSGLFIAGFVLLLALVATIVIAQGLSSPLSALAQATREIGKGRWDAPLPRVASTEIGQLADDFRAMTAALANLDRENRRYRESLEEMVASRTRELEGAYQALEGAYQEREGAYQEMKAMAEAKDQFVATVSHDFRSPLAVILSAVQTVLGDSGMPENVRRTFLSRAERHCKRLGAMVSDLLDLARIENRESVFGRAPLSEIVLECVESARPAFDERRVSLHFEPPQEAIIAEIDRSHVGRALANLLDNALKFTPPSGRVTVKLSRSDGAARISVSDTGTGIPDEERERVFDRFFQGREGQAIGRGSGLGLAIVAGVAHQHGGSVSVTSAVGAGSTFELVLPISKR